jgi:hypothetical protein
VFARNRTVLAAGVGVGDGVGVGERRVSTVLAVVAVAGGRLHPPLFLLRMVAIAPNKSVDATLKCGPYLLVEVSINRRERARGVGGRGQWR